MKNTTSAVCLLLLAVLTCGQLVKACDDVTQAGQCAATYASAIGGLTDPAQICPHLDTYGTCLTTACGSTISTDLQSALDAAKGAVDCSGAGAVAFSPLLLVATIAFFFLNIVLG